MTFVGVQVAASNYSSAQSTEILSFLAGRHHRTNRYVAVLETADAFDLPECDIQKTAAVGVPIPKLVIAFAAG